jgi:hypothetical protein
MSRTTYQTGVSAPIFTDAKGVTFQNPKCLSIRSNNVAPTFVSSSTKKLTISIRYQKN